VVSVRLRQRIIVLKTSEERYYLFLQKREMSVDSETVAAEVAEVNELESAIDSSLPSIGS